MKTSAQEFRKIVDRFLDRRGSFQTREAAAAAGISRQACHRRLAGLVRRGELVRDGEGRGAKYRRGYRVGLKFLYRRRGLSEDRVWTETLSRIPFLSSIPENARRIVQYAFTEILNNAIDHSRSGKVEILFSPPEPLLAFEVIDRGVGIFDHVRRRLRLPSRMTALAELSKGKATTQPERHTGEGIFFVSKIADYFEIESADLRWRVDNVRGDTAVASVAPPRRGTRVRFEVDPDKKRTLKELFDEYTVEFEFTKTRVVVKLFAFGVRFISRSEAKRLLHGLERFKEIVLDFGGVDEVGQGFADEVFRVWSRAHRRIRLKPIHLSPAVEFMVRRAGG